MVDYYNFDAIVNPPVDCDKQLVTCPSNCDFAVVLCVLEKLCRMCDDSFDVLATYSSYKECFVGFRAYVEKETKVGPSWSEILDDRVIKFGPKP